MRSIKTQLTRDWLIISTLLVASIVIAIYSFTQARARQVLDRQLQQFAHLMVVHDLVGDSTDDDDEPQLPRNLMVRQWKIGASTGYVSHPEQFKIPFDLPQGLSTVQIKTAGDTTHLRVYTLQSAGSMIQVAAPLTERDSLSRELAQELMLPVIAILLFFMGVFRWRMRQALKPLQRLHQEIALREDGWKSPLNESIQPEELAAPVHAINQLVQQLLQNLQTQQHFIADAAHELRTPITALRLQLDNLTQSLQSTAEGQDAAPPISAANKEYLTQMRQGVERSARLIEQLLLLARMQHHGQTYHRQSMDIVPLIRETLVHLASTAAKAGMELAYEGPEQAHAQAYPFALRTLLENLLHNALKYGRPASTIVVRLQDQASSTASPEHAWKLSVGNEGLGIDPLWHSRVFERFFRMNEHQNMPGSGLGLSIVREIAQLHGSEVELQALHPDHSDSPEPGLLVSIILAAAPPAEEAPAHERAA